MRIFRSALYDPDRKIITPASARSGMWTVRYVRLPFYDYYRKPAIRLTSTGVEPK